MVALCKIIAKCLFCMKALLIIFDLFPAFISLLLTKFPQDSFELRMFVEDYSILILSFLLWLTTRAAANYLACRTPAIREESRDSPPATRPTGLRCYFKLKRSFPTIIAMVIAALAAIALLMTLQLLRERYGRPLFIIFAAALLLDAGSELLLRNKRFCPSLALRFLAHSTLCYAGFVAAGAGELSWQASLVSIGVGAISVTPRVALRLAELSLISDHHMLCSRAARIYAALAIIGPTALAMLTFNHQLSRHYLILYLYLPLQVKFLRTAQKSGGVKHLPKHPFIWSASAAIVFFALLSLAGLTAQ